MNAAINAYSECRRIDCSHCQHLRSENEEVGKGDRESDAEVMRCQPDEKLDIYITANTYRDAQWINYVYCCRL